jgi:hypothetical protein
MQLQIANVALSLMKKMYRPEGYYQKLGVMLLVPKASQQMDLYAYSSSNKSGRLMNVVDRINGKYRRGTIHLASGESTGCGP